MRCHVALTPAEAAAAPLGIVVDVMRATSTVAQALAGGYRRGALLRRDRRCAGAHGRARRRGDHRRRARRAARRGLRCRRLAARVPEPQAETLILSTTNGTRSIVAAAEACEQVVLGALLNLDAVSAHARESGVDLHGRLRRLQGERSRSTTPTARAGSSVSRAGNEPTRRSPASSWPSCFPKAIDGINARTYGPPGLEEDIAFCAQESVLDVVPRFSRMIGPAAEVVA